MKDSMFSSFALSSLIHVALVPMASLLIAGTDPSVPAQRIEVSLTDIARVEPEPAPAPKPEPKKVEKIKAPRLIHKTDIARVEPNEPPPKREELPPPPPNLTASGPEKGSVASQKQAGEARRRSGCGRLIWWWRCVSRRWQRHRRRRRRHSRRRIGQRQQGGWLRWRWQRRWACRVSPPPRGYQVKPRYPEAARKAGAQGVTLLRVRVLENGRVGEVLIEKSAGFQELDFSAAEAVKKWLFEPARRGKEPVQVWVLLPVKFELH
jgi:TonB family protein